jgi:hypothetical protein
MAKVSDARRREILTEGLQDARARAEAAGHPFAIESRGELEVFFTIVQPPDHWLHKRLTIQSLGLWAPVWWYRTRRGAVPKRYRIFVDDDGDLDITRARRKK